MFDHTVVYVLVYFRNCLCFDSSTGLNTTLFGNCLATGKLGEKFTAQHVQWPRWVHSMHCSGIVSVLARTRVYADGLIF